MMDRDISTESSSDGHEMTTALARLGLGQYQQRLIENGFDTWETVTSITEADMNELNFKLGDRRKLQRAIREHNNATPRKPQCLATGLPLSAGGLPVIGAQPTSLLPAPATAARAKRPYRRHPQSDPNAPRKPKTAYVLFSEHVRRDPAISRLSFAEVAKEVGKRWGNLSEEEKANVWEKPVADKMREYEAELEKYRKTESYRSYQTYLEDFKRGKIKSESTELWDEKALPDFASPRFGQPPVPPNQGRSQAALQGESDSESSFNFNRFGSDTQPQHPMSPIESGMEEVGHMLTTLGINPQYYKFNAFPPEGITHIAVEAFLHGTGSLLCLWDHDEALELVESVYLPKRGSTQLDATELFAMAAIGSYCDGEAVTASVWERFLHFFVSMLSIPSDQSDLRRMRLFTCLAICQFTDRVDSARKLILSALGIGRQVFTSSSFAANMSQGKGRYWWNVYRSIVFLESWFAYNTSRESRVTQNDLTLTLNIWFAQSTHIVQLYRPSQPEEGYPLETFQHRVGELGQLAVYIALDLKTAMRPSVEQARLRLSSLNEWHRTLPPSMQIGRLNCADSHTINWYTKRSLLQLHMLFLGLFNEPYRTYLVEVGKSRLTDPSGESEDLETMKGIERQCIWAARQCARVVSLLQLDNLIRSHCWVSVYTSFTSCTILLFSASQKLFLLADGEISQDLSYATSHLNVLSMCSYNSSTARKLCTTLQIIFNDVREIVCSPIYHAMREQHLVIKDMDTMPPSYYDAVEGAREMSANVVDLARRVLLVLKENINI